MDSWPKRVESHVALTYQQYLKVPQCRWSRIQCIGGFRAAACGAALLWSLELVAKGFRKGQAKLPNSLDTKIAWYVSVASWLDEAFPTLRVILESCLFG